MKNLEHTIRDAMSGKHQKDLLEDVNDKFIDSVRKVYGDDLTEEEFIYLYEQYMNYLIEQTAVNWEQVRKNAQTVSPISGKSGLLRTAGKIGAGIAAGAGIGAGLSGVSPAPERDSAEQNVDTARQRIGGAGIGSSLLSKTGNYLPKVAEYAGKAARVIPGLQTVMGLGTAGYRAYKGDYTGAGLAAASAIPGPVGWAATAADATRDALSDTENKKPQEPATNPETPKVLPPAPVDKRIEVSQGSVAPPAVTSHPATTQPTPNVTGGGSTESSDAKREEQKGKAFSSLSNQPTNTPPAPAPSPATTSQPRTGSPPSSPMTTQPKPKPEEPAAASRKSSSYKETSGQGRDWKEKAFDPQTGG